MRKNQNEAGGDARTTQFPAPVSLRWLYSLKLFFQGDMIAPVQGYGHCFSRNALAGQ